MQLFPYGPLYPTESATGYFSSLVSDSHVTSLPERTPSRVLLSVSFRAAPATVALVYGILRCVRDAVDFDICCKDILVIYNVVTAFSQSSIKDITDTK